MRALRLLLLLLSGALAATVSRLPPGSEVESVSTAHLLVLLALGVGAIWVVADASGREEQGSAARAVRSALPPLLLAAAVAAIGFIAVRLLYTRRHGHSPMPDDLWTASSNIAWMGAIGLAIVTAWRIDRRAPVVAGHARRPWEPWALLAITAVAAAFRFYDLYRLPDGVHQHQMGYISEAWKILRHEIVTPAERTITYADWSAGTHFLLFPFMRLLDDNVMATRVVFAGAGVAAVFPVWGLARMLFGPVAALAAGSLVATSFWQVIAARTGDVYPFIPFLVGSVAYFLVRGLLHGRLLDFALAGFLAGISQFIYQALRSTLPEAFLIIGFFGITRPRLVLRNLPGLALAFATFYATFGIEWGRPSFAWTGSRYHSTSLFGGPGAPAPTHAQAFDLLIQNFGGQLFGFHVRGYPEGRINLPGAPLLELLPGILAAPALAYLFLAWLWDKRALALACVFLAAIAPALVTVEGPYEANWRGIGIAVPVYVAMGFVVSRLAEALPGRAAWAGGVRMAFVIAVLATSAWQGWERYFVRYGALARGQSPAGFITRLIDDLRRERGNPLFFSGPEPYAPTPFQTISLGRFSFGWLQADLTGLDAARPDASRPWIIVVWEGPGRECSDLLRATRLRFPDVQPEERTVDNTGIVGCRVFRIPPGR